MLTKTTAHHLAAVALTSCAALGAHAQLTPAEEAAGWTVLFDGSSTEHWRGYRRDAFPESGWAIEDGTLAVKAGGGGGDIITRETYANFEFVLEFRVSERANSGIMYRVTEEHDTSWQTGPEYQILDDAGYDMAPSDSHTSGTLYDLTGGPADKVMKPTGEWNTARIRLKDGVVEHYLNGMLIVREDLRGDAWREKIAASKFRPYDGFGVRERGHLCLQDHGNDVWFRNIRVRDLDEPMPGQVDLLFNKDGFSSATGYVRDGEWTDAFHVEDGLLKTRGRPIGYIRTTDQYTNYVLRVEWRFNPETKQEGNGGVLVRQIGEDKVWPKSVEAQLQSQSAGDFWNIDEFQMTVDLERTNGRNTKKTHGNERPVGEWNEYEIICDRGLVILRVNGQELNRATNVAEVAGHICLQSEGTEMHFRKVALAPIKH